MINLGGSKNINRLSFNPYNRKIEFSIDSDYKLEERDEFSPDFFEYDIEGAIKTVFPNIYEEVCFNPSYQIDVILPKGRYICSNGIKSEVYNPQTKIKDLYLQFAELGRGDTPNSQEILNFVKKYGMLKSYVTYQIDDIVFFRYWFDGEFRLDAFFNYAKEMNLTIKLRHAIKTTKVNEIYQIFRELIAINDDCLVVESILSMLEWRNIRDKLSAPTIKLLKECRSFWAYLNDEDTELNYHVRHEHENIFYGMIDDASKDIESHPELVFEWAVKVVCAIVSSRLGEITPIINPINVVEKDKDVWEYQADWQSNSLLSILWLQFYLDLTCQSEQSYEICSVCRRPILNPRINQKYHLQCKKLAYTRCRRLAEKMWKENKSIEEIVERTGKSEKTVRGWIDKIERKVKEDD